jgi:hypothetical protein
VKYFTGPVVKQTIITEPISEESSSEPEKIEQEKPAESPVTNEQSITPSDENEKKENEEGETDETPKNPKIELKDPSACKIRFSSDTLACFFFAR